MAWGGFILTNAGRNLLAKVQAGTIAELNITRFGIGDGNYSGSFSTIANLVSQRQSVLLRAKKAKDQYVNFEGYFSNEGLAEGFYFREWGIFAMNGAQEILYAYDNAGADAEYIAPDGSIRYEKLLKAALAITADVNVTINTSGVVYATVEDLVNKADLIDGKVPAEQLPEMNYMSPEGDGKDVTVTFTEALARSNISTGEKLSVLFGKIKKYFTDLKVVAFTGNYTDLSNKPTSLPADGGTSAECSGNAATATKLQTARQINGVAFDGSVNITVADGTKAPVSHASSGTTYGVGTTVNYGHCKVRNDLLAAVFSNGEALSAYQGYLLNNRIDNEHPTPLHVSGTIAMNAPITDIFSFDATKGYKTLFVAEYSFGMFFIDGVNGIVSGLFNRGRDYTFKTRVVLSSTNQVVTYDGSTGASPTYMRKVGNTIYVAVKGQGYADQAYNYDLV